MGRWAGAIDSVGGQTLATVLATTASYGSVASCGLAGGAELPTTAFPFILRNVSLLGINSVQAPKSLRIEAWRRLASELPMAKLDAITTLEPLSKVKQAETEGTADYWDEKCVRCGLTRTLEEHDPTCLEWLAPVAGTVLRRPILNWRMDCTNWGF